MNDNKKLTLKHELLKQSNINSLTIQQQGSANNYLCSYKSKLSSQTSNCNGCKVLSSVVHCGNIELNVKNQTEGISR